jgi:hypothetical protein
MTTDPDLSEAARERWYRRTPEDQQRVIEAGVRGRRRAGTDTLIRKIVERAGELTPVQVERLRALLPAPEAAGPSTPRTKAKVRTAGPRKTPGTGDERAGPPTALTKAKGDTAGPPKPRGPK